MCAYACRFCSDTWENAKYQLILGYDRIISRITAESLNMLDRASVTSNQHLHAQHHKHSSARPSCSPKTTRKSPPTIEHLKRRFCPLIYLITLPTYTFIGAAVFHFCESGIAINKIKERIANCTHNYENFISTMTTILYVNRFVDN